MTMQYPVPDQTKVNARLLDGPADWISPGYDDEIFRDGGHPAAPDSPPSRWLQDPPPADGRKVVISDTDHFAPGEGDALWVWKAFLRGHNPILMDFGLIDGPQPAGEPSPDAAFEPRPPRHGRHAALRREDQPHRHATVGDLSSTGYALAHPGEEYLILQPSETGEAFTAALEPGTYATHWFGITERTSSPGEELAVSGDEPVTLAVPATISGPAVLHLKGTNR